MTSLVKLGKYNHVISQYERYLDYFPNYSGIDEVVSNIKYIIGKYVVMGEEAGVVR